MKTNKFEDTIRRKLESIEPDFQEKDWANMQNYMQAQSPPTFWQQHSSWIGYAAAASVSTVMAFMYVSQRNQNNNLTADVKNLQHQIEAIKNTPVEKTDTVYLVQKAGETGELVAVSKADLVQQADNLPNASLAKQSASTEQQPGKNLIAVQSNAVFAKHESTVNQTNTGQTAETLSQRVSDITSERERTALITNDPSISNANNVAKEVGSTQDQDNAATNVQLDLKRALAFNAGGAQAYKMKYNLVNRISHRQYKQALMARNAQTASTAPTSGKKTEQIAQAENVIPKLNLKVPYRFGVGYSNDQVGKTKSVTGEVLVSKKFSISAGISWLKVKPMEFFNEKLFREKSRRDFRGAHPGEVPIAFQVYNIKVDPTVVQIPLTVAFRNSIKDNWAYYASAGTNITVSAKEKISFDCKAPNYEYFTQHFEAKADVPVVNSVNFAVGLEKTWYPIVVQAEGYLYTYFNQLTPLSQTTGPGVKVKLMYQIGGKM
ncbi:hypothetical protein [Dyadobacter sp. CY326]|uniref:hypothetical protein n=1 Tax=Dyadobacter sp. CY326 TaxID=2907300 RepID=UPI001F2346E2|nr:hypothetical protein [Dyadobacter sp. CY326]MCE7064473.1 hypothetical protein [Dyadobacter sp. CY326]